MSIAIDTTLDYLRSRLSIPEGKLQLYADKSVKEILDAEIAQGNQLAVQMAADMFTDPSQLIELFQLADENNKLIIMNTMTPEQLAKMLPQLEVDDLVHGLQFFTQDSLLDLLKEIPKEEFLKSVFQMFSEAEIIEFMPEKQLDKLLISTDMDKSMLLENLKSIPELYVAQMLESVTGEEAQGNIIDLVRQVGQLGDLDYKNAIMNLQPVQKRQLTYSLTNREPKLYQQFDTDAYTHIIAREREKDEMVKSMAFIKPEYLERMMTHLPQDLLAIVTTQIDTEKFADSLINKFPEVLARFIAG